MGGLILRLACLAVVVEQTVQARRAAWTSHER